MADSSEEIIDAKVKDELEALNSSANSINKLENEVQRARATFKQLKEECSGELLACSRRIGKQSIVRSKEYYHLLSHLFKIQGEVQKATQKFQKANSIYKAALETVSLAEEQLVGEDGSRVVFDGAWQEMLNHANLRFSEAEKEKRICEVEHGGWSRQFEGLKGRLTSLHRNNAKSIFKSKPFYEMKRKFESKLQAERQNAEDLQLALICNKQKYRLALNNLERISEELHVQRQRRSPGVGAESDACSELSDTLTFNFDFLSDTSSQVSSGDLADFDSDLMQEWQEEQEVSIFSKVSTRFNRSTSLSNLGDRNKLSLTASKQADPLPHLLANSIPLQSYSHSTPLQPTLHTNPLAITPHFNSTPTSQAHSLPTPPQHSAIIFTSSLQHPLSLTPRADHPSSHTSPPTSTNTPPPNSLSNTHITKHPLEFPNTPKSLQPNAEPSTTQQHHNITSTPNHLLSSYPQPLYRPTTPHSNITTTIKSTIVTTSHNSIKTTISTHNSTTFKPFTTATKHPNSYPNPLTNTTTKPFPAVSRDLLLEGSEDKVYNEPTPPKNNNNNKSFRSSAFLRLTPNKN